MRPAALERYALAAGFAAVEILPVEDPGWRFPSGCRADPPWSRPALPRPGGWRVTRRVARDLYEAAAIPSAVRRASAISDSTGFTPVAVGRAEASVTYSPGTPWTWPSGPATSAAGTARSGRTTSGAR